jgi:hypothetical protein
LNSGLVRCIIHVSENKRAILVIIASASPTTLAFFRLSTGSLPASMEIKMMLSIPKTISRTVNVSRAIKYWG